LETLQTSIMKFYTHLFIAFLCAFFPYFSYAQELGSPFIRNYTPKMYNAHVQNWEVLQDKRGIMYFGNGDGLMEYDGVNFRILELPNKQTVRSMTIDDSGIIYIGSVSHFGYLKTDSTGKTIFVDLVEKLDKKDRDFTDVHATTATKEGIYFRTTKKLFRVDKNQKITVWNTEKTFGSSFVLQDKFFMRRSGTGLLTVANDSLVPAKSSGVFRKFFAASYIPVSADEIGFPAQKARETAEDYSGFLAYSPFKPYKDTTYLRKIPTGADSFMIKNTVTAIVRLKNNNLVLATNDVGAVMVGANGKLLQKLTQESIGLQNDAIRNIWTDKQNATWLVMNKGITRLELQNPISFWNEANSGLRGTPEAVIRHKGTLYIATHSGLFYIDKQNKMVRIPPFSEQCWSFCNFITPQNDTLLLAATSYGVYEIKNFKGVATPFTMNGSRVVETAFEMYQSKKNPNRLFIGTSSGLVTMRYENGKWLAAESMKGLKSDFRGIAEDKEGNIWLGSFREGIFKIVPNESQNDFANPKSITHYTEKDGVSSLKNTLVYHFHSLLTPKGEIDTNTSKTPPLGAGGLLFGTEKGLIIFDKASNKFVPFVGTLPKQFYDGSRDVFLFQQDTKGNLWASGLFNKTGEIVLCEKQANGDYNYITKPFKSIPEMMVLAFYVEGDSIAWIGGSEGLYRFDRKLATDLGKGTIANKFFTLIRKVRVNQDSTIFHGVFPQETEGVLGKILGFGSLVQPEYMKLKIPYQYNDILIEYAAPNFIDENNTLYSHFLVGYDESWSAWTKLTQKEYTNLREGKYIFKVKAKDVTGNESEVATYQFTILSPWYRAWWAYLLYGLLGAAFVYFVVKYYTNKLEKDKEKLEKLVQKRTEEITLKNTELEQQKEEIEAQRDNLRQVNEEVLLKNTELEQQKEEIEAQAENLREANDEISAKSEQVEKALYNIQTISEIGQKVTASLDLEKIIQLVYENVNTLMDATCFGIGVYVPEAKSIIFQGFIEKGRVLPTDVEIIDKTKPTLAAICLLQQREILINNIYADIQEYGVALKAGDKEIEKSLIYLPLVIESRTVGVITVQSFETNRYQETEVNMLKTLASYISIAIENSHSYEVINQKNRSITDSIRYAETIQKAMLPSEKEMQEALKEYFIFYKPKDVVSGDFYWLSKVQEKVFVAVVDCTGHGVPGAFMSMISISLLHEAVNQQDIVEPSAILQHINYEIRNALKQDENRNRDGMDLVLCKIEKQINEDKLQNKITFAGAKRPLFYSKNGVIAELKGTRKNIGGNQKQVPNFEQTEILLAAGEMLYLSTDGYTDQANEHRDKFGVLTFVDLLQNIARQTMTEQQAAMLNALANHQLETEQRDDITVMGIRLS
jgi:serine phosphatase RsbU (regulator of sigma subunit)/ligand-binding sensor domain-containing protein